MTLTPHEQELAAEVTPAVEVVPMCGGSPFIPGKFYIINEARNREAIGGGPCTRVLGRAHQPKNGKPCGCKCQWVVGCKGVVIERAKMEYEDYLAGLVICEFDVPSHAGGEPKKVMVAYTLAPDNSIFVGGRA